MSTESQRSRSTASSRAEARRRARLVAQGQLPVDEEVTEDTAAPARGAPSGGMLARMFPPAPPLPGKPDPLAGFTYDGPMRGAISTLWLLARHPLSWGVAGVVWAVLYMGTLVGGDSIVGIAATMGLFAAQIGAGWVGWQRPWAFGAAASILGVVLSRVVLLVLAAPYAPTDTNLTGIQVATSVVVNAIYTALFGALAGFYGGYLRRRLAEPRAGATRARRR